MKECHEKGDYIHLTAAKAGFVRWREERPWPSTHDHACGVEQAPSIPTGLSVGCFLLQPMSERGYDNGDKPRSLKNRDSALRAPGAPVRGVQ